MKKLFSIFSAFIFLFGAAGYYLAFTAADKDVKEDMTGLISKTSMKEHVVKLSFSQEELKQEVRFIDRHEFIYRGEHYDVITSVKEGNQTVFNCVNDTRETTLFAWFGNNLDHHDGGNNSGKISFKPLTLDWFFEQDHFIFSEFSTHSFNKEALLIPQSVNTDITTPPPNC